MSSFQVQQALKACTDVFMCLLTGVVNHMAPAGQRMPELTSVTLREQESQKRRMMRVYSSRVAIVGDYHKGEEASDLELAFWFGDAEVSAVILRSIIFLKPIESQLAIALNDTRSYSYLMVTNSVRQVADQYNRRLEAAGLPSCTFIRQVKEYWFKATVQRMPASNAKPDVASLGHHSANTSDHRYGLNPNEIIENHYNTAQEWHAWVLGRATTPSAHKPYSSDSRDKLPNSASVGEPDFSQLCTDFGLASLRPSQIEALKLLQSVDTATRMATTGIVLPTGSGKDLLPMALSRLNMGTSVVFLPYRACIDDSKTYADNRNCSYEKFTTRLKDTAANLVFCGYEQAPWVSAQCNIYFHHHCFYACHRLCLWFKTCIPLDALPALW